MKLQKSEIVELLKSGYYDLFEDELKELAEEYDDSIEKMVEWRYGWHPETVANLLCLKYPNKFID